MHDAHGERRKSKSVRSTQATAMSRCQVRSHFYIAVAILIAQAIKDRIAGVKSWLAISFSDSFFGKTNPAFSGEIYKYKEKVCIRFMNYMS